MLQSWVVFFCCKNIKKNSSRCSNHSTPFSQLWKKGVVAWSTGFKVSTPFASKLPLELLLVHGMLRRRRGWFMERVHGLPAPPPPHSYYQPPPPSPPHSFYPPPPHRSSSSLCETTTHVFLHHSKITLMTSCGRF